MEEHMGIQQTANTFAKLFGQGINFPDAAEARWITDSVRHSPDLGYLEQFEFQLLFAADDTKLNHSHHCLIEDSAFVANAFTANAFEYSYLETGEDRLPIPMMSRMLHQTIRYFPPPLKIQGQIFAIRPYQFRELDNYKQNTVQFRRKRVNLIVPYREVNRTQYYNDEYDMYQDLPLVLQGKAVESRERVHIVRAWMYVGMEEYWNNLLDAGFRGFKTVNIFESRRPWLKEYYAFPKRPLK